MKEFIQYINLFIWFIIGITLFISVIFFVEKDVYMGLISIIIGITLLALCFIDYQIYKRRW